LTRFAGLAGWPGRLAGPAGLGWPGGNLGWAAQRG